MGSYDPRASGAQCDICPLRKLRPVPPEGPTEAQIAFVGEAPGMQEEKQGRPFVGPSGAAFNDLLKAAGLERKKVFVTNAILCRPSVPDMEGKKRFDVPTYIAWVKTENKRRAKRAKDLGQDTYFQIQDPFDCCRPRLWNELRWLERKALERGQPNGLVVQPLGNFAAQAIVGKRGIMKLRGSPITVELSA